jgi:hypothetical protein
MLSLFLWLYPLYPVLSFYPLVRRPTNRLGLLVQPVRPGGRPSGAGEEAAAFGSFGAVEVVCKGRSSLEQT